MAAANSSSTTSDVDRDHFYYLSSVSTPSLHCFTVCVSNKENNSFFNLEFNNKSIVFFSFFRMRIYSIK